MGSVTADYRNKFHLWWIIIAIILLGFYLSRCTTYRKCLDKYAYSLSDTIYTTIYDTTAVTLEVTVGSDSVSGVVDTTGLDYDSLVFQQGRARVKFWKGKYDSLRFRADCLPDTVEKEVPVPYKVEVPQYVTRIRWEEGKTKKNSLIERVSMWVGSIVLIILAIGGILYGVSRFIPFKSLLNKS